MFLEIRNIKKSFGQGDSFVEVLKGINLEINRGEFCVLLGPSGSGKSTLMLRRAHPHPRYGGHRFQRVEQVLR